MRKNYLTKSISISIILMLLAMMFSCQPLTESIDSGNSNGNNTNQGGNTGDGGGAITITLIGTDGNEYNKFDIKIGEEIELPANVERFLCWNTKADGKGESYTGKSKFNKDMTLYLIVLAENAYTITYELDGGVNDKINPLFFTADDKITLKNPSKDGYRFSGWYEKADFSGTAVKGWAAGDKKANVTLYAKWRAFDDKVLAVGGTGVYNYSTYIDALNNGGNSKDYPSFSIFLMTDAQVTALTSGGTWVEKSEFLEATKTKPVYQICSYGEMGADTTKTGDYAVWGRTPVNGKLEYYEGISVSIEGTNFIVTVDMTKLANAELKSYLDGEETFMTDDDTVILQDYKPYISMNLDSDYDVYDSYVVCLDFDNMYKRLYGMNSGASFPTNLKEDAPAVPTFYDLTCFYSNISQYPVELKNNAYTFVAPENVAEVMFFFMNYNPIGENVSYPVFPIQIGGEPIDSLNKNFPLDDLFNPKQAFSINSGVLTAGNMYTITLDVRGNNEAYAKVSEVKLTAIKINSTSHKTSYYVGDDINVANLTVEATTADGTKFTVNVTPDMISGFDSSKLGKQTLTITMDGCTITYSVEVSTANVTELSVTASEVVETIKGLTAGEYYKIKVSGTLDSNTMENIVDALAVYNVADYPKIALDLSNTTGLTRIGWIEHCDGLTSIVLPEGVTGMSGFYDCDNLISITIPASLEYIDDIDYCKKLTTFEVDANNEYLSASEDGKILYNKDKTTLKAYPSATGAVTIPSGVTSIGYEAFRGCNSLTSVIIPDSVISIGSDAFEDCENLESVTIGAGVTSIESDSFSGCSSLTNIKVSENNQKYSSDGKMLLSKDKTTLVAYPSATGDVTIPNSVTSIGSYAFYYCSSLTSVIIPDSVTFIDAYAFEDCENLESVTLGKNVKTIGYGAFEYCYKLASIEIPDSVTKIGRYAFSGCEALTSVTFENTSGWNYTDDYEYTNGTEIDVTDEEQNATNLTSNYRDYYWYRVKSGMYISGFNGSNWASDTDPGKADVMTEGENGVWTFTFTAESINPFTYGFKFTTEKGWQEEYYAYNKDNPATDIIALIPGVEVGIYNKESAAPGDDYTKFYVDSAFIVGNEYTITFDTTKMKVKITGDFDEITADNVHDYICELTSIFPRTVKVTGEINGDTIDSIWSALYYANASYINLDLSGTTGLTSIGSEDFYSVDKLKEIIIPDSVTDIGTYAFVYCENLESVTIPNSVTSIGYKAFFGCYNLTTVNYKGTQEQWEAISIGSDNDYLTDATINCNE